MRKISIKPDKEFTLEDFKIIFENHFEKLRNYIYYKSGSTETAEDIAQDALMKLWEKRDSIKHETVVAYLYKIANNLFINYVKHQQVSYNFIRQNTNSEINLESPEYQLEIKEFDIKLQKTLSSLSEKIRTTFLMSRIDGLKYAEIAKRLDISEKTVEKRMQKALATLKEKIKFKL